MSPELIGILSVGVGLLAAFITLGAVILTGQRGLRQDMQAGDAALHKEIRQLREDMQAGDQALRDEMRAGDQALRDEMRAGDQALRGDISRVEGRFDRLEAHVDARIDRVDERLRAVEHGMARIEGALTGPWPRRESGPPAEPQEAERT